MADRTPALVLLHGFRGGPGGLLQLKSLLQAQGFAVYTPPLPPAEGLSLPEYTLDNYLDYLKQYLSTLECPILIGHSMGSIIAAAFASRYPGLCDQHLLLLAPISQAPAAWLRPLAIYPLRILPPRLIDFIVTRYLYVGDPQGFRSALRLTTLASRDYHPADLVESAQFAMTHTVADFAPQKQACLIAGARDRLIPLAATRALADRLPARLVVLPDTGHLLNYEAPEATARAISEFLAL